MHFEPCIDPKITWFLHFAMYLHNFSYDIQPYTHSGYSHHSLVIYPTHSGYSHHSTLTTVDILTFSPSWVGS